VRSAFASCEVSRVRTWRGPLAAAASLRAGFFRLFFPDGCRLCEQPLEDYSPAPVCRPCLDSLEPLQSEFWCARCGLPLRTPLTVSAGGNCGLCGLPPASFEAARSFGPYEGKLRKTIQLLKYSGMRPLAAPLAERLLGPLRELGGELLVPVPLHPWRRWRRGFNQAALLAGHLSRLSGIPWNARVLKRTRATPSQAGLSRTERRANVLGAFAVRGKAAVAGRTAVLIDDVMTTGATLDAAASQLKRAGAAEVFALTAARAELSFSDAAASGDAAAFPALE